MMLSYLILMVVWSFGGQVVWFYRPGRDAVAQKTAV